MICVGIDVSKDKHDCYIATSEGEVLADVFTVPNSMEGFKQLFQKIKSVAPDLSKVKVGLEATGHYCYNILGFLLDKGLPTFVLNPLHTNLYRKSTSLRRTKTDRVDARTIAAMMMSDVVLKSYSAISYHNEELKSLSRYRFDKIAERAKLKQSVTRLVCILLLPQVHIDAADDGGRLAVHLVPGHAGRRRSIEGRFRRVVIGRLHRPVDTEVPCLYECRILTGYLFNLVNREPHHILAGVRHLVAHVVALLIQVRKKIKTGVTF